MIGPQIDSLTTAAVHLAPFPEVHKVVIVHTPAVEVEETQVVLGVVLALIVLMPPLTIPTRKNWMAITKAKTGMRHLFILVQKIVMTTTPR